MTVAETSNGIYLINANAVGIAGSLLDMPIEVLILGAAGGAIVLGRGGVMTRGKAVSTIIASMMFAGVASPAVVAWMVQHVDLGTSEEELMYFKSLVPFVIGSCWQWALPILSEKADEFLYRFIGGKK